MQSGKTPQVEDKFADIKPPTANDLSYQIQQLVEQGVITPEDAKTALAGRSEMDNVTTDPKLEAAQMGALDSLQGIASSGGLTAADKSNLSQISVDEATKAKGARDAAINNAAARGLGGSGIDLLNQLTADQSSASDKSSRDLAVAGQAQQRALDALMNEGNLSTTVQNNQFNQGAQKANANDAIAKFNAQNQNTMNLQNTQARNTAQATNLANKQNIANTNAGLQTQQNKQKADVAQQTFNNSIAKAGGSQGAANFNANAAGQNSQNAANASNQTIGTAVGAANPFVTYALKKDGGIIDGAPTDFDSEPVMAQPGEVVIRKEDVPDLLAKAHTDKHGKFDAAAFLDSFTGHKYNYAGKGKHK